MKKNYWKNLSEMSSIYKKYILLLPLYVIIQIMILNQILFFSYVNPYLYLILIITLPIKTSSIFLFLYSFMLGFCVDIFSISIGYHSSACILIAFLKTGKDLKVKHTVDTKLKGLKDKCIDISSANNIFKNIINGC